MHQKQVEARRAPTIADFFFVKAKIMYRFLLFFSLSLLGSCSKDSTAISKADTNLSIVLYNKPLDTITSYLNGTWQLRYYSGGLLAGYIVQRDRYEEFWSFSNGKIIQSLHNRIVADATISWYRTKDVFGDSTYLLNFGDTNGSGNTYVVDRIFNDTLILFDNATDPFKYRFTRIN